MNRSNRHIWAPMGACILAIIFGGALSVPPAFADEPPPDAAVATAPGPVTAELSAATEVGAPPPVAEPDEPAPATPVVTSATTPPAVDPAPGTVSEPAPVEPMATPTPGQPDPGPSNPVTAADDVALPDLWISARFAQGFNDPHEPIDVDVHVLNRGPAPATGVRISLSSNVSWASWGSWGALDSPGARIEPDGRVDLRNAGMLTDPDGLTSPEVQLRLEVRADEQDRNPNDNAELLYTSLILVRGGFTGVVYGDRNGNGAMDPSEGLAGVFVRLEGVFTVGQSTDRDGRFSFQQVPAGHYNAVYMADGWWFDPTYGLEIDGVDDPEVVVRGVPDYRGLAATLAFTKAAYAPGEAAHLTVTLTNNGPAPMFGVGVAPGAGGVTILDGATRTRSTSTARCRRTRCGSGTLMCGAFSGRPSRVRGHA